MVESERSLGNAAISDGRWGSFVLTVSVIEASVFSLNYLQGKLDIWSPPALVLTPGLV